MTPPDYAAQTDQLVYDPQLCQHDPDGTGAPACDVAPGWLVQAPPAATTDEQGNPTLALLAALDRLDAGIELPSWLVCQLHLAELVLNVADSHGEPVLVSSAPIERAGV